MLKIIAVLFVVFLACTCTSTAPINVGSEAAIITNSPLLTLPRFASLALIGVSGRQLRLENEIENAREDAARKVSMYHALYVRSETVQHIGSGLFDYYIHTETMLEYDEQFENYIDKLSFNPDRDVIATNSGAFVRFSYPAFFPGRISNNFARDLNERPLWTYRVPREINGFLAGVGFSGRQFRLQDTFEKSRDSAAAAIAAQLSTTVTSSNISVQGQNITIINQLSEGRLAHFLVLEIWVDPETQAVWTLAVAQKAVVPD